MHTQRKVSPGKYTAGDSFNFLLKSPHN